MVIWKYPITADMDTLIIPKGSTILNLQVQSGEPYIWVEVPNPLNSTMDRREVLILATGENYEIPHYKDIKYIGTFQLDGGSLVFHLYELIARVD